MEGDTLTVDRRWAAAIGLIMLVVIAAQWQPFYTRQEAHSDQAHTTEMITNLTAAVDKGLKEEREHADQQASQASLRMTSDEGRMEKDEDHYAIIQQEISDLNANMARYNQQVQDSIHKGR